ncbi:MAG: NAD(P)H-dependent oxidoreductase subunit E [Parvularculaceae bacterium]
MPDLGSDKLQELIDPFVGRTGGLISALRAVQSEYGFLPEQTDAAAARAFNLSRAEVKGVISFYRDFARGPKGNAVIRICAAEACQAVGAREIIRDVEERIGVKLGEKDSKGGVTLEAVYCLGLCSCGPAATINENLLGRADADKIVSAVENAIKRGVPQ